MDDKPTDPSKSEPPIRKPPARIDRFKSIESEKSSQTTIARDASTSPFKSIEEVSGSEGPTPPSYQAGGQPFDVQRGDDDRKHSPIATEWLPDLDGSIGPISAGATVHPDGDDPHQGELVLDPSLADGWTSDSSTVFVGPHSPVVGVKVYCLDCDQMVEMMPNQS